jgi:hypothetical protein
MSDQVPPPPPEPGSADPNEGWQEVGRQFRTLGESLAAALRAGWENEETRSRVQDMQTGLAALVSDVGQAIQETVDSPGGQQVKAEAQKAASSVAGVLDETAEEVRPQLVSALRLVNTELQRVIDRLKTG